MNVTIDPAPPRYLDSSSAGSGSAHAKAILFGEHAVVYGAPALATPVPGLGAQVDAVPASGIFVESALYTGGAETAPPRMAPVLTAIQKTLDVVHVGRRRNGQVGARVRISSNIPPDRGLGSSAAVAAAIAEAVAAAYGVALDVDTRFDIAQDAERTAHGNPSGLDARTVLAAAPIRFHQGRVRPLAIGGEFTFVLADTGVPGSTATAVAGVRALYDTDLGTARRAISALADLSATAEADLRTGDAPAVGAAMSSAHELLRQLGVSVPELDGLVVAARHAGALGAKLTGGGLGGCVLSLARSATHAESLAHALRAAGAVDVWTTTIADPSVHP